MEDLEEIRHLGRGAFGEVLLMKQKSSGLLCAVKRLSKTTMTAGEEVEHLAEVKALQALNHPCILRYYGSLEGKEQLSLVMEYADAGDLQQLVKGQADLKKNFEGAVLFALFAQLAVAVAHVHAHRVLHRDLKPSNVMLTSSGLLKLGDFGVAKVLAGTTVMDQMTCVGSPTYMAPEIVGGEPYGAPCDVWSLGVILYELTTFRRPFEGRSLGELVMRISSGQFQGIGTHLSDMPGGHAIEDSVNPLIARMLVTDVKRRAKMPEVLRIQTLQLFVTSMRTCATIVASAIADAKEPTSSKEIEMLETAGVDVLTRTSEEAQTVKKPAADAAKLPKFPKEARNSLAAKATKEVVEDSLAFSMTSDGAFSSMSSTPGRMTSKAGTHADAEITFSLTATDATNLAASKLPKETLTSKSQLTSIQGLTQSQDRGALRGVLGNVLEESAEEDQGSSLHGTRAMEEAVLADAMNERTSTIQGPSDTANAGHAKQKKEESLGYDGSIHMGHVNPGWHVRTALQSSGNSSGSSTPSNSPPWSRDGDRPRLPSNPSAPKSRSGHEDERPSPSPVGHRNLGAPALRAAGAVLGSQGPSPAAKSSAQKPSVSQMGAARRQPSQGSSRSSQSRDNDRSVTWPSMPPVEVVVDKRPVPRKSSHQGPAVSRSQLRSTTPPAGRPTTPESARLARLEKERLRSMQRNGAMTIPFFDGPPGSSQPSPPKAFLESIQAHDHRQKQRDSEKLQADLQDKSPSVPHLPAAKSVPAIAGGHASSPSPARRGSAQDRKSHSTGGGKLKLG